MQLEVTVQVSPDVARALHQRGPASSESRELQAAADELGLPLKPLHPRVDDPALARYLVVEVPDATTGERVAARLRQCAGVDAAYLKPPGEAP